MIGGAFGLYTTTAKLIALLYIEDQNNGWL